MKRSRRQIWIGLAIGVGPLVVLPVLFLALRNTVGANSPGSPGFSSRSNAAVIASLATSANTPWDWQELDRRLTSGRLSDAEVTQAIDKLIAFLKTQPTNQPLSWAETFFKDADRASKITDEQYQRLSRAYYTSCTASIAGTVRAGAKLPIVIHGGGPWQLPGVEFVYALRSATLSGGSEIAVVSDRDSNPKHPNADFLSAKHPWDVLGNAILKAPPGQYTLTLTVDVAVLREKTAPQLAGDRPGQAAGWPKGRAAWTEIITVPITIVPSDVSPIALVTDSRLDPQKAGAVHVNSIRVIRKDRGQRITVDLTIDGKTLPCSFDVLLRLDGKEYPLGMHVAWSHASSASEHACDLASLDPSVQSADVLLRPNAKYAEGIAGIDRVWGGPVDVLNIPLQRYDLPAK